MRYISLGRHCDVAFNIEKYASRQETNFFDWVRVDFKSVLYILNLTNIETILNKENISMDKISLKDTKDILVTLQNFSKDGLTCSFRHDIPLKDYSYEEMNEKLVEFIDKYKRRFHRLIDVIKSNEKLVFIHRVAEPIFDEYVYMKEFNQTILSINKNAIFCLVLLIEDKKDYLVKRRGSCLRINISTLIDPTVEPDWTRPQINWLEIFNIIQKSAFEP